MTWRVAFRELPAWDLEFTEVSGAGYSVSTAASWDVELVEVGPQGPPGPPGVGTVEQFIFTQASAAAEWGPVNHNRGVYPLTDVRVGGLSVSSAEIVHTSTNQLYVRFSSPQSGQITCI
jgi:hypothetical protein